jgi:hypothetical protein
MQSKQKHATDLNSQADAPTQPPQALDGLLNLGGASCREILTSVAREHQNKLTRKRIAGRAGWMDGFHEARSNCKAANKKRAN